MGIFLPRDMQAARPARVGSDSSHKVEPTSLAPACLGAPDSLHADMSG